jgi:uncharacterized protein YndB with AHSA1/START domain
VSSSSDRIQREIFLRAPVARVWQALATPREFGTWFGVDLDGEFTPGARLTGRVTHPGYEHLTWDVTIERMDAPRTLAWRWHPHAIDAHADYSSEATTLVEFELDGVKGGTQLRVTESGFDRLPPERRDVAYRGNADGWTTQLQAIQAYVS